MKKAIDYEAIVMMSIFIIVGILCLTGVFIAGAWWHLFTSGICAIMAYILRPIKLEEDDDEQ